MTDRLIRRTVHVSPMEEFYGSLGVAEGHCDRHGVWHVSTWSWRQGRRDCPFCAAVDRGTVAA